MITIEEVLKWEEEAKRGYEGSTEAEAEFHCDAVNKRILALSQSYKILSNLNQDLEIENKVLREMIGKHGSPLDEAVRQPGCIHGFKEPMLCEYCRDGVPF